MAYDKRITDLAAKAAEAAAKNAKIAPQLLVADITFVLADAVSDGRISLGSEPLSDDGLVERLKGYVLEGDQCGSRAKHPTTIAVRIDIEKAANEIERLRAITPAPDGEDQ